MFGSKFNFKYIFKRPSCSISQDDKQSVGRVYLYKYPNSNPVAVLTGESEFDQFGYSFDLSIQNKKMVIAVASVSKESKLEGKTLSYTLRDAGVVQVFDISNLGKIAILSSLKSDRANAAFGSKLKVIYPLCNSSKVHNYTSTQILKNFHIFSCESYFV